MVQTLGGQRIGQGLHHVVLAHHFSEIAGAVLSGEHEVGHAGILKARPMGVWASFQIEASGLP